MNLLNKALYQIIFLLLFAYLMLKLCELIRKKELFRISFLNSPDLGFESKKVFFKDFDRCFAFGCGSMVTHIFADPYPDPKHWV